MSPIYSSATNQTPIINSGSATTANTSWNTSTVTLDNDWTIAVDPYGDDGVETITYSYVRRMRKKAIIHTDVLFRLNKSGRNVLAYIIDNTTGDDVYLDPIDIVNYLSHHISQSQANTVNVKRGIKNLIDKGVLLKGNGSNTFLLSSKYVERTDSVVVNPDSF